MTHTDFDQIWGAIPYPAFVIGPRDRIRTCNPEAEAFAATSLKQMADKPLAGFVGESSPLLEAIGQARREAVSVVQHDIHIGWADKPPRIFNLHAAAMQERGAVLLLLHPRGMAEQMDRSLSHRSAARSVAGMAAMLAHEIRNPLAGISGAAQLLSMSLPESERELTELIQDETKRIGDLVERVEQFGELRPTVRNEVNIHDVLDRAKRAAEAGFAAHVRFREDYDPSLPPTAGDPDQLMQVMQNLLKNAAEAVPEVGGVITLRTGFQPGVKLTLPGGKSESVPLLISLTDNGKGIPDSLIKDIFDPFVSSKANGSGLGLSLVSKVLSDHGGVIECDSEPGRTEFRVRLPVWRASADDMIKED
ncbi:two-component system sensor histidine kinase NtrB [Halovulum sp. GXIMD14793]